MAFGDEASTILSLQRLRVSAEATFSQDGAKLMTEAIAQQRVVNRIGALLAEEFAKEQGIYEGVELTRLREGFVGMISDVIGSAFEGFIDDSFLNDAERLFRQDGRLVVLSLFAAPVDVIYGLFSRKLDRILDLLDQGGEILSGIADKVAQIGLDVVAFDRLGVLARNALLFAAAAPLAKELRDQVDDLLQAATAFDQRDFTFNIPGLSLPVICVQLEVIADLLVGDDPPATNLLAKIAELQSDTDRLLSILDNIVTELLGVPDFDKNLADSRRNLASLRAAELDKLRRLLDYFIELAGDLDDKSPLAIAQQASTFGTEFKRMVSLLCRDQTSIADAIVNTVEANALNALNLALAQIPTEPITEFEDQIRSFIAVARAMVTQDITARFDVEFAVIQVAINALVVTFDLIQAAVGGFPQLRSPFVDLLIEGLLNDGFTEAAAALKDGKFDDRAAAAAHLQSSAGVLIDCIHQEIELVTDADEKDQLFEIRDFLVAFERSASALSKSKNARTALDLNIGATVARRVQRIEDKILQILARRQVQALVP